MRNLVSEQSEEQPPPITKPVFDFLSDQFPVLLPIFLFLLWRKLIEPRIYNLGVSLRYSYKQAMHLREVLIRLQALFDCDRVVIAEFVNGETNRNKTRHYWKLRIIQEVLKPGVSKIETIIGKKYIDVSTIPEEIEMLLKQKTILFERNRKLPVGCYRHLQRTGAKTLLEVLITTKNSDPAGILSIQYCSFNKSKSVRSLLETQDYYDLISLLSDLLSPDSLWKMFFDEFKKN